MKNFKENYFYDLPNVLQERIHDTNIEAYRDDVRDELTNMYNGFKYTNTVLKEKTEEMVQFMDENNFRTFINEEAILENLSFLKENIIEKLNSPPEGSHFKGFKLKKEILIYLENKFENVLYNYNTDEEIHYDIECNISEETITWEDTMTDLLIENCSIDTESDAE